MRSNKCNLLELFTFYFITNKFKCSAAGLILTYPTAGYLGYECKKVICLKCIKSENCGFVIYERLELFYLADKILVSWM